MKTISFRNSCSFHAISLLFLLFVSCNPSPQQQVPSYLNPKLPTKERVNDLISRMTLEEKISQLRYDAPAIERLGIPAYNWWNECLHGVARSGRATVFPQAIGLAATWDQKLMFKVSTAISDEARAKYHDYIRRGKHDIYQGLTFWSPNINIFRDPRWGRGMETYGEDPFLTGQMGLQFIKGLQGDHPKYLKIVATAKHFAVHSGPEPIRHSFDARISHRDLYETYLPHFRTSVVEGNVQSVMCAYNMYMGDPCCGNTFLLEDVLRKSWGFDGYVVSDCWALTDFYNFQKTSKNSAEAGAKALKAGTDLNCGVVYRDLQQSIDSGLVGTDKIDLSLKRILTARFRLGMFDPDELVPFAKIPIEVNDCDAHRDLALQTARESIVLLKNENNFLPLKKDISSIAVIGPNADDVEVLLGNYNGTPSEPVTILEGIKNKGENSFMVNYALGCNWAEGMPKLTTVPSENLFYTNGKKEMPGLIVSYFDNAEFEGQPVSEDVADFVKINFWDKAPLESLDDDNFGVRWSGLISAPVTGNYLLGAYGNGFRVFLNDSVLVEYQNRHESHQRFASVHLEKGKKYPVTIEAFNKQGDCLIDFRWLIPNQDFIKEATEAARKSEVVVLCLGLSPRLEGEEMDVPVAGFSGGDRISLDLPQLQQQLMEKIFSVNKNLVLVLLNGSALTINWADQHIPAIVEAWYPGQAGGTAIADVLFGDYNPAGRLPVTFYKSVDDIPPFENYDMKDRTYRYFEGEVLYPFGYGLSYTQFEYRNLQIPSQVMAGDDIILKVDVKNTGNLKGDEVVEIFINNPENIKDGTGYYLVGFQRVNLNPGETKTISFTIHSRQLSVVDETPKRVIHPGIYSVSAGGGLPDQTKQKFNGLITKINISGKIINLPL